MKNMIKDFKLWLIKKLVGDDSMAINCTMNGGELHLRGNPLVQSCIFMGTKHYYYGAELRVNELGKLIGRE
jgi:hypothetical protein